MPLFSVILPIYNVEKYLTDCIESILKQTFEDFELILVNDGSKDNSGVICDLYAQKDARVRVIHKTNGGAVSARKAGLQTSCGDYIVYVDSDDYLALDYLEQFCKIIKKAEADIIATCFMPVTETGTPTNAEEHPLPEGLYVGEQLKKIRGRLMCDCEVPGYNVGCFPWSVWAKAVKRELMEKAQLSMPDNIRNGDDCAVMIPAVCDANSLYVSNYCGYYYRQVSTSIVHTFNPKEGESLNALLKYLRSLNLPIPQKNLVAFGGWLLWDQTVKAARNSDSAKAFAEHMQRNFGEIISYVLEGTKHWPMPMGLKLRMTPIRYGIWYVIWCKYRKRTENELQSV